MFIIIIMGAVFLLVVGVVDLVVVVAVHKMSNLRLRQYIIRSQDRKNITNYKSRRTISKAAGRPKRVAKNGNHDI